MAYRADIEIAVKGAKELVKLQKQLDGTAHKISEINKKQAVIFQGIAPSVNNFTKQLQQAQKALDNVAAGIPQETRAVKNYVTALENSNKNRERQNRLIEQEIIRRNGATNALKAYNAAAAAPTQRGASTTMAGAYLRGQFNFGRTQYGTAIGPQINRGRTQYATSIGPQIDRTKMLRRQAIIDRTVQRTKELSGLQKGLAALSKVEADARLESARSASQQKGDLAALARDQRKINQYAQPIGPKPAVTGGGRVAGNRGGGTRFRDIATGAGFPLLFGGGPLQALAGGVGGAFGGLGGSIALSAIVAQAETFGQVAAQTGQALNSTGGALDLMREKSLFSTEAVEENARVLEEQGKVAELSALLTSELVDKIGNNGVEALQNLGTETDETTRLWNELTLQLQALISGPLQGFLNLVNNFLGGVVARGRLSALSKDLEGTIAGRRLKSEIKAKTPQAGFFEEFILGSGQGELPEEVAQKLFEKYKGFRKVTAELPQTLEDQRRFTIKDKVKPRGRSKGIDRAAREEERLQQRLAKLRLERDQIAEITKFKDRIAAAEAASDQLTAARIKGEQRVFEIEQQRLNKLIGVKDQREIDEINITNTAKKVAAMLDTEREMAEIQRQKTELFENTVENLELQLAIATATTREEAEQLRIQQEMKGLEGKGFSKEQLERIKSLKEGLNQAQQPLNKFIIDSTRALNDLEQVAVNVSQGIGSAIGNSLNNGISSLIEGSGSVKEVFADMLKSIGQVLAQEGTKMIATYIAIGIARIFAGISGGGGEAINTESLNQIQNYSGVGANTDVSSFAGAFRSSGGPVNRNSAYIVGENGPELFRPTQAGRIDSNSDMRSMMSRQRNTAPAMNFTFETTNIGGQEFVSREQLEAAMAVTRRQAASDGAKRGMNMTLDKMQQSPATRRRVGIS